MFNQFAGIIELVIDEMVLKPGILLVGKIESASRF